jgi:hypothetical protein
MHHTASDHEVGWAWLYQLSLKEIACDAWMRQG